MSKTKLTAKQKRFCEEYMKDLNATQAAIRAGYSEDSARFQGCENLTKPNIQEEIQRLQKKATERNKLTVDKVIQEYMYIAFGKVTDVADFNGRGVTFKDSDELPDHVVRAISEVSSKDTKEGVDLRVKMHDKKGALDSLSRHLGLFNDKLTIEQRIDKMEETEVDKFIESGLENLAD